MTHLPHFPSDAQDAPPLCQSEPLDRQALNDAMLDPRDTERQTKLATALRNGFDPDADVDVELTIETYPSLEADLETIANLEREVDA